MNSCRGRWVCAAKLLQVRLCGWRCSRNSSAWDEADGQRSACPPACRLAEPAAAAAPARSAASATHREHVLVLVLLHGAQPAADGLGRQERLGLARSCRRPASAGSAERAAGGCNPVSTRVPAVPAQRPPSCWCWSQLRQDSTGRPQQGHPPAAWLVDVVPSRGQLVAEACRQKHGAQWACSGLGVQTQACGAGWPTRPAGTPWSRRPLWRRPDGRESRTRERIESQGRGHAQRGGCGNGMRSRLEFI